MVSSIFTQVGTQKCNSHIKVTNTDNQPVMTQENISTAQDKCEITVCPVMTTLAVIGGKWKPAILWELQQHDILRFGALKRYIPDITQKMLTQQLRELEDDGIVSRKVYAEIPPRVEYRLTEYGQTLRSILDEMAEWGLEHQSKTS